MLITLTAAGELFRIFSPVGILIALLGSASMVYYFFRKPGRSIYIADILTASRFFIASAVLIYSSITKKYEPGYFLFILLSAAALSDLFDGIAARKWGSSPQGADLDAETDAFFVLMLACSARFFGGYGLWVLSFGLVRYIFVFLFPSAVKIENPGFRFFAKFACVCASVVLVGLTAPFVSPELKIYALYGALTFILLSFLLEGIIRLRKRRSNGRK